MDSKTLLLSSVVALVVSIATGTLLRSNTSTQDILIAKKTTFKEVDARKTINCGFISYPPAIYSDKQGNVVGVFAESMEKAAENLGWKVNWIEGSWPDLIPNLNSNAGMLIVLRHGRTQPELEQQILGVLFTTPICPFGARKTSRIFQYQISTQRTIQ